jgi:hypothetical protein
MRIKLTKGYLGEMLSSALIQIIKIKEIISNFNLGRDRA